MGSRNAGGDGASVGAAVGTAIGAAVGGTVCAAVGDDVGAAGGAAVETVSLLIQHTDFLHLLFPSKA